MEPIARHNRHPLFASSLAYAGAALIFALSLRALARKMVMPASEKLAPPDWSVTVTAIERRDDRPHF